MAFFLSLQKPVNLQPGLPSAPMPPWPRSNSWAVEPLMKLKELELVPFALAQECHSSRSWGLHGTGETYNIYTECINVGVDLGNFEVCVVSEICGPPMMKILEFQRNTKYIRQLHQHKKNVKHLYATTTHQPLKQKLTQQQNTNNGILLLGEGGRACCLAQPCFFVFNQATWAAWILWSLLVTHPLKDLTSSQHRNSGVR